MKTRAMGKDFDLVQFRKEFKQLQADCIERSARQDRFEKKQGDQFAFMSAKQDQCEKKQDEQFERAIDELH
jgi:hypothetical protein